jgi:hypothetical protein
MTGRVYESAIFVIAHMGPGGREMTLAVETLSEIQALVESSLTLTTFSSWSGRLTTRWALAKLHIAKAQWNCGW